jgi:hypothetical protein
MTLASISGIINREYLKDKINELETVKTRTFRVLYRGMSSIGVTNIEVT